MGGRTVCVQTYLHMKQRLGWGCYQCQGQAPFIQQYYKSNEATEYGLVADVLKELLSQAGAAVSLAHPIFFLVVHAWCFGRWRVLQSFDVLQEYEEQPKGDTLNSVQSTLGNRRIGLTFTTTRFSTPDGPCMCWIWCLVSTWRKHLVTKGGICHSQPTMTVALTRIGLAGHLARPPSLHLRIIKIWVPIRAPAPAWAWLLGLSMTFRTSIVVWCEWYSSRVQSACSSA